MTEQLLKPCPFCGSKSIKIRPVYSEITDGLLGYKCECHGCWCSLFHETESKVQKKWNTRKVIK